MSSMMHVESTATGISHPVRRIPNSATSSTGFSTMARSRATTIHAWSVSSTPFSRIRRRIRSVIPLDSFPLRT